MSGQATQNVTTYSRLTSTPGFEFSSDEVRSLSDEELQRLFAETVGKNDFRLVKQGFRTFSANLLARGLIEMEDYAVIFGGQAVYQLTVNSDGRFVHAQGGGSAEALAQRYSLAKYGSVDDIQFFADMVIATLGAALDDPSNAWRTMFETAMTDGDEIVMMTMGWSVSVCTRLPECPGRGSIAPPEPGRRLGAWRSRSATWFRLLPMACLAVGGQIPLRAGRSVSRWVLLRRLGARACSGLRPGNCPPASSCGISESYQNS